MDLCFIVHTWVPDLILYQESTINKEKLLELADYVNIMNCYAK